MDVKPTYIGTMLSLATIAFGLLAAGAWNKAITDILGLFLKAGAGPWAELIYAFIVTIIAIVVMQNLSKLAERDFAHKKDSDPKS